MLVLTIAFIVVIMLPHVSITITVEPVVPFVNAVADASFAATEMARAVFEHCSHAIASKARQIECAKIDILA